MRLRYIFIAEGQGGEEVDLMQRERTRGRVFCWKGDPESKELEDGEFDMVKWRKYFKSG